MNKVIILCDNHHNGLGVVRSFGRNGYKPYGIIIAENSKEEFVSKSKYWEKTFIVNTALECIDLLKDKFHSEIEKPILIPCSDTIAMLLDSELNTLEEKFIIPNIRHKQGKIVELMDKENQVSFSKQYGIPIAETWVLKADNYLKIKKEVTFPCIVKPVSSYEGKKADIKKFEDILSLTQYLDVIFIEKKYSRIMVQKFIDFDYEIEFVGCCSNCDNAYIISKTHRGWPVIGGTNSFFQIINNPKVNEACASILSIFNQIGFTGLFDVEMFNVNGKIFMNEINWRNTGNSFFTKGTAVDYPVIWYLNMAGIDAKHINHMCVDENEYAMNEATDFRHVVFNKYSFTKWNKERKKTESFALWYKGDNKPTFKRYRYLLKKMMSKNRGGNHQ